MNRDELDLDDRIFESTVAMMIAINGSAELTLMLDSVMFCGTLIDEDDFQVSLGDMLEVEAAALLGTQPATTGVRPAGRLINFQSEFLHLHRVTITWPDGRTQYRDSFRIRKSKITGWALGRESRSQTVA